MFRYLITYLLSFALAWTSLAQKDRSNSTVSNSENLPQHSFIIKQNSLYGIGDSGHFYKNTPTGDTIFHLGNVHFAVRNAKRFSIYHENGVLLQNNLKDLKEFGEFVVLSDSAGWRIFSKKENKTTEYYDSIRIHLAYALLFKKNKQGILNRSWTLSELIPPLFDKVGAYYEGILLINNGKLGWKGVVTIPVEYDHIYKEQMEVMAAKNKQGIIYYSLITKKKLQIEPTDSLVFYDNCYKRVRGKQQSVFDLQTDSLLGETNEYEIHPYSFDHGRKKNDYMVAVKDSMCGLFRHGKLLSNFIFENILPDSEIYPPYFRVVQKGKVAVINDKGEFKLSALYSDVVNKRKEYFIVRNRNNLGICKSGDTIVLPVTYQSVIFENDRFAEVSSEGKFVGLYDYINQKMIIPCNYDYVEVRDSFMLARRGSNWDVFYNSELKLKDLTDLQTNSSTVKGYKNGKIYMGHIKNNLWEEYSYEIQSYKIVSDRTDNNFSFINFIFEDLTDLYDYSIGKWGRYRYSSNKWEDRPLVHSGYYPENSRILAFHNDSLITWQGISFFSAKTLVPIEKAWSDTSRYRWMDVNYYAYSSDSHKNTNYRVSPVCYTSPGSGIFSNYQKSGKINTVFPDVYNKSVYAENGKIEITNEGESTLSDFITRLCSSGNCHPATITDYENIIEPSHFVKITNAIEHILHRGMNDRLHISKETSFEWLDKKEFDPFIFRIGNTYGLMSDSGTTILKPLFESIESLTEKKSIFKIGIRSGTYKIYDPETKLFSRIITNLMEAKDGLLLTNLNNLKLAVLNQQLDTILKSTSKITLLGGMDLSEIKSGEIRVYRAKELLFVAEGESVEKINDQHYLLRKYNDNSLVDVKGNGIFKSNGAIRHLDLGLNYLLDDGKTRSLFDKDDKLIHTFQKSRYLASENQDLIIKNEESIDIFKKNEAARIHIPGKFLKFSEGFVIVKNDKYKDVYTTSGDLLLKKASLVKILDDEFISYKTGKNVFLLNVKTKEKKKVKKINVDLEEEEIDETELNDSNYIAAQKPLSKLKITQNKGLYGLRSKSKIELDNAYFTIKKLSDVYLVQDEMDYKLFNAQSRIFITDETAQAVYPYKDYLMLMKDGHITYIRN